MELSSIRFGVDGWVARTDDGSFSEAQLIRIAEALGMYWQDQYPGKTVVVGYDTRYHAKDHARLLAGVLKACGVEASISHCPCPLPSLGWTCAQDESICGGVMLTASHKPEEYQGVKLCMADGSSPSQDILTELESLIPAEPSMQASSVQERNLLGPYFEHLASLVDVQAIAQADLHVVVDPMYGAAQGSYAQFLSSLGVTVHEIHGNGYGDFHGLHPNPIEPWVDACEQAVQLSQAQAGFVFDGDGDRSALIDEQGSFVGPHRQAALILQHLVHKGYSGRVVRTASCSRYVRRLAEHLDCPSTVLPIGFKWIKSEFEKGDVMLGVEEYGGLAYPHHLMERDALYTVLLILERMAQEGKALSCIVDELEETVGHFDYARRDLRMDPGKLQALRVMLPGLNPQELAGSAPEEVGHGDGLCLSFTDDSWILVRPSRMESIVRVYAEAHNIQRRDSLMEAACKLAEGEAGISSP